MTGPRVVVSCQEPPHEPAAAAASYNNQAAVFLATGVHGAVTIRSRADGCQVEAFRTGLRLRWP